MVDEYVLKTECKDTSKKLLDFLLELNTRLYKDNGTKSIQTQISELTIATTNLTNALAEHIKADKTALSRNLNIAIKSMVIATMLYGLILFIIRTAPLAMQGIG